MRYLAVFIITALLMTPTAAFSADQAQAREVARMNNCPPKKIDVYQQSLGPEGKTVYRIECILPKTTGSAENAGKSIDTLLVGCDENLCDLLRPVASEKK